jgi:tRNA A37 threonylcarbamoyladenosine dehydratase
MERFLRIDRLIGRERREILHQKRVTVVGVGAVGSYAVEALARSGVGALTLIDFDRVEITNLNRQLIALESTLGQLKVDVAKRRIADINPLCRVITRPLFVDQNNLKDLFSDSPDIVVDAIDSLDSKVAMLEYLWKNNLPVVSSMGAALRTDPEKLTRGDLMNSKGCPLAKQVRQRLRRLGVGQGITAVYSTEKVDFQLQADVSIQDGAAQIPSRGILGSLPTLTGMFGLFVANEVLVSLLGEIIPGGQK